MKFSLKKIYFYALVLLIITSCGPRRKLVYFQTEATAQGKANYTPTFQKDDLLSIVITSDNIEASVPFNLPQVTSTISSASGYTQGNPERSGYLIDNEGMVNLPILGKIKLEGLTRPEAVNLIEGKLTKYLSNPIANIQILNFKISVLGDVRNPGTFKIPNERITILEALGLSGDIDITGRRNNLLVIRDKNGVKEQYRIDITNTDSVFTSPAYYLQQNDVVYVEPNLNKRSGSSFLRTTSSIFISIIAVIISTINTFSK